MELTESGRFTPYTFGLNEHFTQVTCLNSKPTIAEAAYYKAEKRAFKPESELRDWQDGGEIRRHIDVPPA